MDPTLLRTSRYRNVVMPNLYSTYQTNQPKSRLDRIISAQRRQGELDEKKASFIKNVMAEHRRTSTDCVVPLKRARRTLTETRHEIKNCHKQIDLLRETERSFS